MDAENSESNFDDTYNSEETDRSLLSVSQNYLRNITKKVDQKLGQLYSYYRSRTGLSQPSSSNVSRHHALCLRTSSTCPTRVEDEFSYEETPRKRRLNSPAKYLYPKRRDVPDNLESDHTSIPDDVSNATENDLNVAESLNAVPSLNRERNSRPFGEGKVLFNLCRMVDSDFTEDDTSESSADQAYNSRSSSPPRSSSQYPSRSPSQSRRSSSQSTSRSPSQSPLRSPSQSPPRSPSQSSLGSRFQSPLQSPTQSPPQSPSRSLLRSSLQSPLRSPTQSPPRFSSLYRFQVSQVSQKSEEDETEKARCIVRAQYLKVLLKLAKWRANCKVRMASGPDLYCKVKAFHPNFEDVLLQEIVPIYMEDAMSNNMLINSQEILSIEFIDLNCNDIFD